jgi:nuclear pore complex protein Nup98-Nup96
MTLYNVSARRRAMDFPPKFPCLPTDCHSECVLSNGETVDPFTVPEDQKKHVQNFTIIKDGFGSILFEGATDVSELDLVKNEKGLHTPQITWEGNQGECTGVSLYPDDETKPKVGTQLNKRAIITLDFLKGFDANAIEEDIAGDGDGDGDGDDGVTKPRFISYSTDTGKLQFEVQHFSRYGLSEKVTKLLQAGQDRR